MLSEGADEPSTTKPSHEYVVYRSASFDEFYRGEWASVVRLARVLTANQAVAEELAQDVFLEAYRRWKKISQYDNPGAWVRRVTVNRCVSLFRRRLVETRVLLRERANRAESVVAPRERSDEVWAAVRGLPPRQAQVVALVVVEDRSVEEAAVILGIGEATARTHMRRARRALAKRLGETEEEVSG